MEELTSRELEQYLPQVDALALLEDIDAYFSGRDGYAGTPTQQQVVSKRVELQDRANLVTLETVIFLKALLVYADKAKSLPDPWPRVRRALERLMTIV